MTEQERIKKVVLDSIADPRKANTIISPHDIPSPEEEISLRKHNLPLDIDKPIRKVIIELNEKGFTTGGSCCGHNPSNKAFIHMQGIMSNKDKEEVKSILVKHGLQNLRFLPASNDYIFTGEKFDDSTSIEFKPIETSTRDWDITADVAKRKYGITDQEYKEAMSKSQTTMGEDTYRDQAEALMANLKNRAKALAERDFKTVAKIDTSIRANYRLLKSLVASSPNVNRGLPDRGQILTRILNYLESHAGNIIPEDDRQWSGKSKVAEAFEKIDNRKIFEEADHSDADSMAVARRQADKIVKRTLSEAREQEHHKTLAEIRKDIEQSVRKQYKVPPVLSKSKAKTTTSVAGIREKYNL